jgi:hypothetical protein
MKKISGSEELRSAILSICYLLARASGQQQVILEYVEAQVTLFEQPELKKAKIGVMSSTQSLRHGTS